MSYKAQRVGDGAHVLRFDWLRIVESGEAEAEPQVAPPPTKLESALAPPAMEPAADAAAAPVPLPADVDAHLAELERDAFAKGYAAGERAGVEAGTRRADAMLRRVAQTIDDISQLRRTMVAQTERQMVQLALTIATRVVGRELSTDVDLVAALAHVALERLGEASPATIRLNPEDHAQLVVLRGAAWEGTQVTITPDPQLPRGGCVVESEFGRIDAGVDAQIGELSRALLGSQPDDHTAAPAQEAHV